MLDNLTSNKIYRVKFMLSVGIVIYHANLLNTFGYQKSDLSGLVFFLDNIMDMLGEAGNTLFIFFAGYFMFLREQNYLQMIKKKVRGLLVPLVIWNLIGFLLRYHALIPISEFAQGLALSSFDGPLWFLGLLFVLALLYPAINMVSKNKYIFSACIIAIFAIRVLLLVVGCTSAIVFRDSNCIMWYLAGAGAAKFKPQILVSENQRSIRIIYACILVLLTIFYGRSDIGNLFIGLVRPVLVWGILNVSLKKDFERLEIYKVSFFIFASHYFFMGAMKMVLQMVDFTNTNVRLIALGRLICGGVIAIICMLVGMFVRRKAPRVYAVICGR